MFNDIKLYKRFKILWKGNPSKKYKNLRYNFLLKCFSLNYGNFLIELKQGIS